MNRATSNSKALWETYVCELGGIALVVTPSPTATTQVMGRWVRRILLGVELLAFSKPVIAYSPKLGPHAITGINNASGIASNDLNLLLDILAP